MAFITKKYKRFKSRMPTDITHCFIKECMVFVIVIIVTTEEIMNLHFQTIKISKKNYKYRYMLNTYVGFSYEKANKFPTTGTIRGLEYTYG